MKKPPFLFLLDYVNIAQLPREHGTLILSGSHSVSLLSAAKFIAGAPPEYSRLFM
ncbi:hypothetical protein KAM28_004465 [Salmonella enterica subsp. diarizonae serovar 47:k:z53:[z84]]|nr:hypothetical protein [Salmonella enterica subsp. diarizonae serovar 47:k:z53:[z84]]